VISPEGCAGILWKSLTFKEQAARALKMTSKDLLKLGVIDAVIPEPLGGAHRDHHMTASRLKMYLRSNLRELLAVPRPQLLESRYQKFRRMGVYLEGELAEAATAHMRASQVESAVAPPHGDITAVGGATGLNGRSNGNGTSASRPSAEASVG